MTRMTKWTQAKLEKEITFAAGFNLQDEQAVDWLRRLMAENNRRHSAAVPSLTVEG